MDKDSNSQGSASAPRIPGNGSGWVNLWSALTADFDHRQPATYWHLPYCVTNDIDLQAFQPKLENGSVYGEKGAQTKGIDLSVRFTVLVDYRPPSQSSKTVLSTVHDGGPECTVLRTFRREVLI